MVNTATSNKGAYSLKRGFATRTIAVSLGTGGAFVYSIPFDPKELQGNIKTFGKTEQSAIIIKKAPLTYTEPEPNARAIVINSVYEGVKSEMKSKRIETHSNTTEVEYGNFDFQVFPLKKLPKSLGKVGDMDEFLSISPRNLTEIETAHSDIFVPRDMR